jgi:alanyl-tRNA synthetase
VGLEVGRRQKVCPSCGAPVEPGAKYCWKCGAKLEFEDLVNYQALSREEDLLSELKEIVKSLKRLNELETRVKELESENKRLKEELARKEEEVKALRASRHLERALFPLALQVPQQVIDEIKKLRGTLEAVLYDSNWRPVVRVAVRDLINALERTKGVSYIVFDGVITQRLVDIASSKNVTAVIGARMGDRVQLPDNLVIRIFDDFI